MENERLKNKKPGDEPGSGSSLTPTRKGYKKTEVGVVPEDWWVSNLGAVCAMKSGEGITSEDIDQSSQYPCYGGNGLRGFTSRFTHDGCYALIGRQGALCGNIVYAKGKLFASEHAVVVTAKPQINILWLTYVLYDMRLNQYSESSAQPGLSVNKLLSLELAVPPTLAEQSAIAAALSDADEHIQSLEQLIAKKRQVKQGAMQELLIGKRRLPGFENKRGFKKTVVGVVPEDWRVKSLGHISSISTGNTPSTHDRDNYGDEFLFVSPADMGFSKHISHTEKMLSKKGFSISRPLPMGSVLFVCIGSTIGKCGIASETLTSNQQINAILPSVDFSNDYLYYAVTAVAPKVKSLAGEQAVPIVNKTQFSETAIPIPPTFAEQTAIASILSDMDAEISALESNLSKTRKIKQGMMQELLTGRIRLV
jgi:type I restriction enzyme S subunit